MKMIKRLLCYIVCLFVVFNSAAAATSQSSLPEDFSGPVTLDWIKRSSQDETLSLSAQEYGMILWEIGRYFYEKYPNEDAFYQEDFIAELRPFFPEDNDRDLQDKVVWLRNAATAYRAGRAMYDDIIKEKLVPHIYKAVHSEKDYDHEAEVPYFETAPDEFIKVYNFKKFLSYSHNNDETNAIEDFERARSQNATTLDKLNYAWDKISWKDFLFYGYALKNPLFSEEGVSELIRGKYVNAQLLARKNYIDGQKELTVAVHILTDERHFILANNVAADLPKLTIDLSASENIEDYEILYPVPFASRSLPAYHKYFGDFLVPIKIGVKDVATPVQLKAAITATVCNTLQVCETQILTPQLTIKPSGEDFFENGFDNFFAVSLTESPLPQTKKLSLQKFMLDNDVNGQSLRLEFTTAEDVHHFYVYLEEKDGYTLFAAPLISIADNKIFVRFIPQEPLKYDLTNSEFIISANLNNHQYIRQELFAKSASDFDVNAPTLNWGLILMAIIGGLILNFMPCVFPVLSFKITALCHALDSTKKLRRTLWLTIFGIFLGFTIIITGLIMAKTLGYALGWGMQYQHMSFLVIMLFLVVIMVICADKWQFATHLPENLLHGQQTRDIISGTLIVLLATPCTGPYLASAIGFALTGSRTDIAVILYAVALGLCLPYLLILCLKEPQTFLPKPGAWMHKLNWLIRLMIWLTIAWFMSLIHRQTDIWCTLKLAGILLFSALLIKLYLRYMAFLDWRIKQTIPMEFELKTRHRGKYVLVVLIGLLITVAVMITNRAYEKNYAQQLALWQTEVDLSLIKEKLSMGHSVLLEIGADWCLTCHYNDAFTLTPKNLAYWQKYYNLDFIRVDWTNYNEQTLQYMARYGRKGLPFYVLYTPLMREGMVLPEIFTAEDIRQMLLN